MEEMIDCASPNAASKAGDCPAFTVSGAASRMPPASTLLGGASRELRFHVGGHLLPLVLAHEPRARHDELCLAVDHARGSGEVGRRLARREEGQGHALEALECGVLQ